MFHGVIIEKNTVIIYIFLAELHYLKEYSNKSCAGIGENSVTNPITAVLWQTEKIMTVLIHNTNKNSNEKHTQIADFRCLT